ncbi:MAG: hypothetical protein H6737_18715 [Alphaproteobacteria bacterium]|nr:hypothetical protein [Alphaproteobacteria bacterium]
MSSPVPEPLRKTVASDGENLTLWVPGQSMRPALAGVATAFLLLFGLAATVLTLGVGAVVWLAVLPLLIALWVWVFQAPLDFRLARVGANGLSLLPPRPERDGAPERIRVHGPLGRTCKVWVGKRLVLETRMDVEGAWRPSTLTWFAQELARVTGAPLEDQRPVADWYAWEHDPILRAVTEFDVRRLDAEARWQHLYHRRSQPMKAEMDHHGMKVRVMAGMPPFVAHTDLEMSIDRLQCGDHDLDLGEVLRVDWFPRREATEDGDADALDVQVLTRREWVRLFTLRGENQVREYAGAMTWLCEQIRERAEYAHGRRPVDQGQASDVPAALKAIAAKRADKA